MSAITFFTSVQDQLQFIEGRIREQAGEEHHSDLRSALGHLLSSGGKRIRPTLGLLVGNMLGAPEEKLITLGASVELLHTATLVHDDLIDGALLRRGMPTLIDGGNYNPGLVYVDNLVVILLRAASLPQARDRIYNGYDGTTVTLRQYFTDLARIVGAAPPKAMPRWFAQTLAAIVEPTWKIFKIKSRPLLTRDSLRMVSSEYQISTDRVCGELGFVPRISYAEGIRRVEVYWREFERGGFA